MLKDLTTIFRVSHYLHAVTCQLLTSKVLSVPILVNFCGKYWNQTIRPRGETHRLRPVQINRTWKQNSKDSYKLSCIDSWWAELFCATLIEVKFGLCISWQRKRCRVGLSSAFVFSKYKSPVVPGLKCNGDSFRGAGGGNVAILSEYPTVFNFCHTFFNFDF